MKKHKMPKSLIHADKALGLTAKTEYNWRKAGAPLRDLPKLAIWAARRRKLAYGFLGRLADLRRRQEDGGELPPAGESREDWKDFLAQAKEGTDADPKASMAALLRARDFATFMFEKAAKTDAREDQKFYADLLAKFESVLHDAQLRAKRLGIDAGDLFPRSEHERIVAAWAHYSMRSIDSALSVLCRRCVGLQSADEAREVIEPILLGATFYEPFKHAVGVATGNKMPPWFLAALTEAVANYISEEHDSVPEAMPATAEGATRQVSRES